MEEGGLCVSQTEARPLTGAFLCSILPLRGSCVCALDWDVLQWVAKELLQIHLHKKTQASSLQYQESKLHLIAVIPVERRGQLRTGRQYPSDA